MCERIMKLDKHYVASASAWRLQIPASELELRDRAHRRLLLENMRRYPLEACAEAGETIRETSASEFILQPTDKREKRNAYGVTPLSQFNDFKTALPHLTLCDKGLGSFQASS
jgi:hypothetical protein